MADDEETWPRDDDPLRGPEGVEGAGRQDRHEEFVLLFSKERRRIFGFTFSLVPITTDAEDVFQQVSLILWRKFHEYEPDRDFYKWACGIVFFTVQNYRRKMARRNVLFSNELIEKLADERLAWSAAESERADALRECIAQLQTRDRELMSTIYGDGVSPKETAQSRGQTVQSIYNRLSWVRKRLLECVTAKLASPVRLGE